MPDCRQGTPSLCFALSIADKKAFVTHWLKRVFFSCAEIYTTRKKYDES